MDLFFNLLKQSHLLIDFLINIFDLMEAANNVARYSTKSLEQAEITINITVHMCDISVRINGDTKEWDVERYVTEIKKLAYSLDCVDKNFGEFKGDSLSGRGIWLRR